MAREMKDSGIEWVKNIPASWEIRRNKTCFDCSKEIIGDKSAETQLLSLTTKGIKQKNTSDSAGKVPESYDTYQVVVPNDIVMCLFDLDMSAVFSGISNYLGMISPAYKVLKCKKDMYPQYAAYWFDCVFNGRKFKHYAKNLRYTLNYDEFAILSIIVPPLSEQKQIASYLDAECAHIDAVMEQTRASIEEYKKLKQALITQAVTKGIRPNRPMKDSGVDWIGTVPCDWTIQKLKNIIIAIESGVSVNAAQYPAQEGEIGVLKTSCVSKFTFLPEENKAVNQEEYDRVACPVKANTIIMSRMNTPDLVGACGYVDENYPNLYLPDRLWQVHFSAQANVKYIWYYLNCKNVRNYYASLAVGTSSSMQNISQDQFYNTFVPIPTTEEQKEIVAYLDEKIPKMDALVARKEKFISEFESYKKSMIYEYVTGKKMVKGW